MIPCADLPTPRHLVVDVGSEHGMDSATYFRYGKEAYYAMANNKGTFAMYAGDGPRFEAFLHRMAVRAHTHGEGVSFFCYSDVSLHPS